MSDDKGDEAGTAPPPAAPGREVGLGDVVAEGTAMVARPIARILGRRGPCADCDRRKAKIRSTLNKLGTIRIGRRPR